jgi:protoheme IX farnesyltransferase
LTSGPSTIALSESPDAVKHGIVEKLRAFSVLSKARLSALVLMTTAVGFVLAESGSVDYALLLLTIAGTGLAAFGVSALNQRIEIERDRRMRRTALRPLPSGVLSPGAATAFGLTFSIAGPLLLLLTVNWISALLTLICELVYVVAYTPMKVRSPLNTLVGAICGALPPMIGWAAVTGGLEGPAWLLGAILFIWQIPHFLALAWLYRDDYLAGGFKMLSGQDPDGSRTANVALLYAAVLVPVTLGLSLRGPVGALYFMGALVLGIGLVAVSFRFCRRRNAATARKLFLASVLYLPLLLGLMIADRTGNSARSSAAAISYTSSLALRSTSAASPS